MQSVAETPKAAPATQNRVARNYMWSIVLAATAIALLSNLSVLFWGLNRGLDTDVESFYLIQYQHPQLYTAFSSFHLLLSKLPKFVASEILHYRYVEIIVRLGSAALLSTGFMLWSNRWLQLGRIQTAAAILFSIFGGSMVFCCFPRTISYNGLSSGLLMTSTALTFFGLWAKDAGVAKSWIKVASLVAAGFCVALAAFVKFTAAFALVPVLLAVAFVNRLAFADYLLFFAGIVSGAISFFAGIQPPLEWWQAFSEATEYELMTDHSPTAMTSGSIAFARKHWWQALVAIGALFAFRHSLAVADTNKKNSVFAFSASTFSVALLVGAYIVYKEAGMMYSKESIAVVVSLVFFLTTLSIKKPENRKLFSGLATLFVLPLAAAVGTNCSFLPHAMSNAAPWFLLIILASFACAQRYKAVTPAACVPIALLILSSVQFFQQYIFCRDDSIYLPDQTESTSKIPALEGMKLQAQDITFYEQAQRILRAHGFQKGDYILSLYDFPAIVYLLEGLSPGQSWYISWPQRDGINAYYFEKATINKSNRFFLVLSGEDPKKIVGPKMEDELMGAKLNRVFKRIGELKHPHRDDCKVYFYESKPKN
ncbi:MAG TPA: hypothetical protein V6C76_14715 [Drouetiella sp.]